MVSPDKFHKEFLDQGVEFFVGVPDSLLKEFCAYVDAVLPSEKHVIAANEGAAVAIAAGYHLATGAIPLVYMQNSGLGNAVNPLLSLVDEEVYAVPVVLLIGWRGEPGHKDEPQHIKQGRVTRAMLQAMNIPYWILGSDEALAGGVVEQAVQSARLRSGPAVILVQEGAFSKSAQRRAHPHAGEYSLTRERAIECVIDALPASATIVSTTGKISRELYELRRKRGESGASDFLTVGSMGHASQIALGISIASPDKLVVCIDGDGASLMHLGGLTSIGTIAPENFVHIILNNGAHESVGGQPTAAFDVSLSDIARASGYRDVIEPISEESKIETAVSKMVAMTGPVMLELRVATGARADLGRPEETPQENKRLFVNRLRAL